MEAKQHSMTEPKKLLNSTDKAVTESLEGLVASSPSLQLLDGLPDIKVVLQSGAKSANQVTIIAGGGAGHEPAMAGYVGRGHLSAAVSGEIFASPSAEAVTAAIRAVAGPQGCLVVVMNYTGDRLHFGLAVEQAKAEGLKVDMLVVGDDCALASKHLVGRRGVAGTVLVLKVAGAAAAAGASLGEVKAEAEAVISGLGTVGMATDICKLPGAPVRDRLGADEMEVGLGIHGEPGAERTKLVPVDKLVPLMMNKIVKFEGRAEHRKGQEVVLLINNMGSTPPMELYVVAQAAQKYAEETLKVRVVRLLVGTFMTSLDMAGVSITIWPVTSQQLERLDAPSQAPGWPNHLCRAELHKQKVPLPEGKRSEGASTRPESLSELGRQTEAAIQAAADALISAAQQLDEWDSRVGDGDCGTTLRKGAEVILSDLTSRYPLNSLPETATALGRSVSNGMGGSSGALYHIFFTAVAGVLNEKALSPQSVAQAFQAGVDAIAKYGGAKPGDRTMLDALVPAARALQEASGSAPAELAHAAAEAAQEGADKTKSMSAAAGRSAYVPQEELKNTPDPGAQGVAVWLAAVAKALQQ